MENKELVEKIVNFVGNSADNFVSDEDAICPNLAGMKIYEDPLVGFARADDELFITEFKKEGIIHPEYLSPLEWLSGAKTVISFFLPFTKEIKQSNRNKTDEPYAPGIPQRCSTEWLPARIEGQMFYLKICQQRDFPLHSGGRYGMLNYCRGKRRDAGHGQAIHQADRLQPEGVPRLLHRG